MGKVIQKVASKPNLPVNCSVLISDAGDERVHA